MNAGNGAVAFATQKRPRVTPRRFAALSFVLESANVGDRGIASIAIDGAPAGERFAAVIRCGQLFLCEQNAAGERCSAGTPLVVGQTVHLYGVVASDTSTPASFALAIGTCGTPQTLPVTSPFGAGEVRGSVGCIAAGPGACALEWDDVVLFTAVE